MLLNLPEELIIHILSYLSLRDLVASLHSTPLLHAIFAHSAVLQYTLQCQIAGVEDNPASSLTVSERFKRLQKREIAWSNFTPDYRKTIEVPHHPSGIYDLTGGIYLLGDNLAPGEGTNAVNYVVLPGANPNEAETKWPRIDVGRDIIDIGLALQEHDLIALITKYVVK
jgi:hypothetical protein